MDASDETQTYDQTDDGTEAYDAQAHDVSQTYDQVYDQPEAYDDPSQAAEPVYFHPSDGGAPGPHDIDVPGHPVTPVNPDTHFHVKTIHCAETCDICGDRCKYDAGHETPGVDMFEDPYTVIDHHRCDQGHIWGPSIPASPPE